MRARPPDPPPDSARCVGQLSSFRNDPDCRAVVAAKTRTPSLPGVSTVYEIRWLVLSVAQEALRTGAPLDLVEALLDAATAIGEAIESHGNPSPGVEMATEALAALTRYRQQETSL